MTHGPRVAVALGLACVLGVPVGAQTPLGTAFSYQGRLTDNGTPSTGPFDLQFILYDAPGGGNQVGPILQLPDVAVAEGLFTVPLDFGAVFAGNRRWLEIGVRPGASTGPYSILSPRQDLTASPASLFSATTPWTGIMGKPAGFADDIDNDTTYTQGPGITVAGTVISVATGGVTSAMIADGAIAGADIGIDVITAAHIAPGAVTSAEIAADTIAAVDIATGAVTSVEILDGTVTSADIATDTITAADIATGAVETLEIEDGSVTSADIAVDTIQAADIASGAIGASEIGPDAVGTAHIQNGTIAVVDLNTVDVDARYVNTTEVLTGTNYGGCGTYSLLSCGAFIAGNPGPSCDQVPVGGVCRATGTSNACSLGVPACADGSSWYLKLTP